MSGPRASSGRTRWQTAALHVGAIAIGSVICEVVLAESPTRGPIGVVAWWIYGWMAMVMAGFGLLAVAWIGVAIRGLAVWAIRVPGRVVSTPPRRIGANALEAIRTAGVLLGIAWMTGFSLAGVGYWLLAALGLAFTVWFAGPVALMLVYAAALLSTLPLRRWVQKPEPRGWPTVIGYALGGWVVWDWTVADMLPGAPVASLWDRTDGPYLTMIAFLCAVWAWCSALEWIRTRIDPTPPPKPTSTTATPFSVGPLTPKPVWATNEPIPSPPDQPHWSHEPVIGWRSWECHGGILTGMYGKAWHAKSYEATCESGHQAPQWSCSCGIYAVPTPPYGDIVGRVELTGTVIEHEHGYRAEHAKITHLWVPDAATEVAVRRNYRNVAVAIGRPMEMLT